MDLVALPAFTDNYVWLLHDGERALVVDPGEAAPVERALSALGLRLSGILVTHHHADHVGGVNALRAHLEGPVFGPAHESIPGPYEPLEAGGIAHALGLDFEAIEVPGHTAGHIAYFARPAGQAPLLFCGDTLFSAGCGRLFEGTPAQMHASLGRLASLPDDTRVCCAHEYTLSNLRFAHAVEPTNDDVVSHIAWSEAQRAASRPTLPSRIDLERRINPFLRCDVPAVKAAAREHGAHDGSGVAVFAALREWKNSFR